MSARLGNPTPLAFPNSVLVDGRTGAVQGGPTSAAGNAVNLGVQGATSAIGLALGAINGAFNLDVALTALEQHGQAAGPLDAARLDPEQRRGRDHAGLADSDSDASPTTP